MALTAKQAALEIDDNYNQMIDWLLDCFEGQGITNNDCDGDYIRDLNFSEACKAVNRHYDGGIEAFMIDCPNPSSWSVYDGLIGNSPEHAKRW
jgi:hypothetical protein